MFWLIHTREPQEENGLETVMKNSIMCCIWIHKIRNGDDDRKTNRALEFSSWAFWADSENNEQNTAEWKWILSRRTCFLELERTLLNKRFQNNKESTNKMKRCLAIKMQTPYPGSRWLIVEQKQCSNISKISGHSEQLFHLDRKTFTTPGSAGTLSEKTIN